MPISVGTPVAMAIRRAMRLETASGITFWRLGAFAGFIGPLPFEPMPLLAIAFGVSVRLQSARR